MAITIDELKKIFSPEYVEDSALIEKILVDRGFTYTKDRHYTLSVRFLLDETLSDNPNI